jgi:predicted Zn-dependent protease
MSNIALNEKITDGESAPDRLHEIQALYDAGLMMKAYEASRALGPMRQWKGAAARILAGRLAMNLGSPALGQVMHYLAYRDEPTDDPARYYYSNVVLERRGPLKARDFMKEYGLLETADAATRADWLARMAGIAGRFRDFDHAESLFAQANAIVPDRPWLLVERAHLYEMEDRYDAALAAGRESLGIRPWYRPGVQTTAHVLQLLDRDDEAMNLLMEAATHLENGPMMWQLAVIQEEKKLYQAALESLDQFERLSPLPDKRYAKALAGKRSDLQYYRGNRIESISLARKAGSPILTKIADRLEKGDGSAKRVLLDVPFVRQHHMTCAPATLSALSRFWSMPVDHLALAEEICYDGTPAQSERNWAQTHGWVAREFTVTWDAATALLDRGVVFTLTMTEISYGHLQAVVGYDANRGTLLVRDPFRYQVLEFHGEMTFERYASAGPRGMPMVPKTQASRLDDVELPDAEIYDLVFEIQMALKRHDRPAAAGIFKHMAERFPGHRLLLQSEGALAYYDGDPAAGLESTNKLIALYADDPRLQFVKAHQLRTLGRRAEQMDLLEKICANRACDPVFEQQYAELLSADARQLPRAQRLLRRAMRKRAIFGTALHSLAGLKWATRHWEEALQLYRDAACLDGTNETAAQSYFIASRHLRQTDVALAMLRGRFDRYGKRSSQPVKTLYWAYDALDRTREALDILQSGQQLRPDDGDLALYAADAYARRSIGEKARTLLAQADGHTHRINWLRGAAAMAAYTGNLRRALQLWRQVLEAQPLAMDAHAAVARYTAGTDSPAAALAHLKAACERFPLYYPLSQLRIQWLRDEGPQAVLPVAQTLAEQRPADAWTRRELAWALNGLGNHAAAMEQAELSLRLEPNSPSSHLIHGLVLAALSRRDEAAEAWRRAIAISVDFQPAISELIGTPQSLAQRRAAIQFVYEELVRQVIFGDGLLAYRQLAGPILSAEELGNQLREALAARPDLWHAWSAIVRHLVDSNQLDEAQTLAQQASQRFPLLPRVWLDLAHVGYARRDHDGEINALRQAVEISPAWSMASRELAAAYARKLEFKNARAVLAKAIAHDPLDGANYAQIGDVLWKMKKRRAAIVRAKQAVLVDPGIRAGWDSLREWLAEMKQASEAVRLARELSVRRAGEARSWMVLASILTEPGDMEERLAASEKSVALSPRSVWVVDQHAAMLADAGRFDEAIAAARSDAFGPSLPTALQGRVAWILYLRGQTNQAIETMTSLLKDDPGYFWGWVQLCNWLRQHKRKEELLKAAATMAVRFPNDVTTLNYLGDGLIASGKRTEGKEAWQKSMDLAPGNDYAGYHLLDAQIKDDEFEQAEKTLGVLASHHEGPWIRQRRIVLAVKRRQTAVVKQNMAELCKITAADPAPLYAAAKVIDEAKMSVLADNALDDFFKGNDFGSPDGLKYCAEFWMTRTAERCDWDACKKILEQTRSRMDAWLWALRPYMEELAKRGQGKLFDEAFRLSQTYLASTTRSWGGIGFALYTMGRADATASWLADYATRKDVQPWMIYNLVLALRRLGLHDQAAAAGKFALGLPKDHVYGKLVLWTVFDDAPSGRLGETARSFEEVNRNGWPEYHAFLARLALAIIRLDKAFEVNPVAASKKEISDAVRAYKKYKGSPELRWALAVAKGRVVQASGKFSTRLWAWTIR